jgi:hypothetical protein
MSDRRTGMPVEGDDDREEAAGGAAGYRGERAQDRSVDDPELRREIDTVDGPLEVEDSSGSQHVEAERVAARPTPSSGRRRPRRDLDAPPRDSAPEDAARPKSSNIRQIGIAGLAAALIAGAAAYVVQTLWKRDA